MHSTPFCHFYHIHIPNFYHCLLHVIYIHSFYLFLLTREHCLTIYTIHTLVTYSWISYFFLSLQAA
jgi:hypothetical protein